MNKEPEKKDPRKIARQQLGLVSLLVQLMGAGMILAGFVIDDNTLIIAGILAVLIGVLGERSRRRRK